MYKEISYSFGNGDFKVIEGESEEELTFCIKDEEEAYYLMPMEYMEELSEFLNIKINKYKEKEQEEDVWYKTMFIIKKISNIKNFDNYRLFFEISSKQDPINIHINLYTFIDDEKIEIGNINVNEKYEKIKQQMPSSIYVHDLEGQLIFLSLTGIDPKYREHLFD
jgi:dsDNA-binding SOS-regulon protein